MTSPDGTTWTSRASAAHNNWRSVTYGNGVFVAVSGSGRGNRVMTSGALTPNAPAGPSSLIIWAAVAAVVGGLVAAVAILSRRRSR